MIHEIPLLRSLDPHHARLGYLGALACVAVRTIDTYDALIARYRDLLYERFYKDDARFTRAIEQADPAAREQLLKRAERDPEENPAAILSPPDRTEGWLTRSEAWLFESTMPSHNGYLMPKHAGRTVDLARWTGVILPTLDLSERGFLLQYLITGAAVDPSKNLLLVRSRPALVVHYFRLLLEAEILFPALLCELAARTRSGRALTTRGQQGLLRGSVARLMESIGEPTDPEDVLSFRSLREFGESIQRSPSTEENYLRPRLEMLVDLGIVERQHASTDRPGSFPWLLSSRAADLVDSLGALDKEPQRVDEWLEAELVGALEPVIGLPLRPVRGEAEILLWFGRAFLQVGREIGFTPGRTVAELATLLAAENGVRLEVGDVYAAVYAVPASKWASYFRFSGGSRFDREFMIKVDEAAVHELERAVAHGPPNAAEQNGQDT